MSCCSLIYLTLYLLVLLLTGVQQFNLRRFMSTESEQLIWKSQGLPSDDLSMENALIILKVGWSSITTMSYLKMFIVVLRAFYVFKSVRYLEVVK